MEEGGPNALPSMVLSGYTFYAIQDDPQIGTMPTRWPDTIQKMDPGSSFDLPEGYYTGGLICTGNPLNDFTSATATEGEVSDGWTGWKGGLLQVGTMAWWGSTDGGPLEVNGTHGIPEGQHDGEGEITQLLSTQVAANITPGTSQKTVVATSRWVTGNQTVLGNGNLIAGNIRKGVNIFGVVGTFEFTRWTTTTDWIATSSTFQETLIESSGAGYTNWVRYTTCNIPFAGLWPSYGEVNIGVTNDNKIWGIILGPDANKYPNWALYLSPSPVYLQSYVNLTKIYNQAIGGLNNRNGTRLFYPVICRPVTEHHPINNNGSWGIDQATLNQGYSYIVERLQQCYQSASNMTGLRSGKSQGGRLWLSTKSTVPANSWTGWFGDMPVTHIRIVYCSAQSTRLNQKPLPNAFSMRFTPGECPLS